jgi:pimeloyl-ACP methyl ester carboxylesterase
MPTRKLREFLDDHGIKYVTISHPVAYTAQEIAAVTHISNKEVAKTVIVKIDSALAIAVLPSSYAVNLRLLRAATGGILARLGIARLTAFLVGAGALRIARFSVSLLSGGALNQRAERLLAPLKKLPPELWPILRAIWVQPKFFEALASEMECLPESAVQVATTGDYSDIPLVVLSACNSTTAQMMEQEAVARLSSNGKIIVVPNSGHWIQLDQPQFVIDAIREVFHSARR